MSLLAALVRPFWLPGLNSISGKTTFGLPEWFVRKSYQSYAPLRSSRLPSSVDEFSLQLSESDSILLAYASDCDRLATAAFESVHSIYRIDILPRSTAWFFVKYYYASYFAAHAVLRMLGVSCSNIDGIQQAAINEVIDLYGMSNGLKVPTGNYRCCYDTGKKELTCIRHATDKGGSHQFLWATFCQEMRKLSDNILRMSGVMGDQQQVSTKLDELCNTLCSNGNASGGWLISLRNRINYRQDFGAWYPYTGVTKGIADDLFGIRNLWLKDPMTISLSGRAGGEQARFVSTCAFIISLARSIILDMAKRHPENKSFHKYGSMAFLNLVER